MPKVQTRKAKRSMVPGLEDMMEEFKALESNPEDTSNFNIVLEKYNTYKEYIGLFVSAVMNINSMLLHDNYNFPGLSEIINDIASSYKKLSIPTDKFNNMFDVQSTAEHEDMVEVKKAYYKLCESSICETIMKICVNIKKSKIAKLPFDEFIQKCLKKETFLPIMNGIEYKEYTTRKNVTAKCITLTDFNEYFPNVRNENVRSLLVVILDYGYKLHGLWFQPDIDVSLIFDTIMKILDNLSSNVKTSGHGLDIIKRSKDIFEKNFTKYYKSSKITQNPMSMMTDFISDIVDNSATNPEEYTAKDINEVKKIGMSIKKMVMEKMNNMKGGKSKNSEQIMSAMEKMDKLFDSVVDPDTETEEFDQEELTELFEDVFKITT